jgi:hypothetical protein
MEEVVKSFSLNAGAYEQNSERIGQWRREVLIALRNSVGYDSTFIRISSCLDEGVPREAACTQDAIGQTPGVIDALPSRIGECRSRLRVIRLGNLRMVLDVLTKEPSFIGCVGMILEEHPVGTMRVVRLKGLPGVGGIEKKMRVGGASPLGRRLRIQRVEGCV